MDLKTVWMTHAPEICTLVGKMNKHRRAWQVLYRLLTALVIMTVISSLFNAVVMYVGFGLLFACVAVTYENSFRFQRCERRIRQLAPDFFGILGTILVTHGDAVALYLWCIDNEYHQLPDGAVHADDLLLTQAEFIDSGLRFQHLETSYPVEASFDLHRILRHKDGMTVKVDVKVTAKTAKEDPVECVAQFNYPDTPDIWARINPAVIDQILAISFFSPSGIWVFREDVNDFFTRIAHFFSPYDLEFEWTATYESGEPVEPMLIEFPADVEVRHSGGNDKRMVNYLVSAKAGNTDCPFIRLAHLVAAIRGTVEPKIRDFASISQPRVWRRPDNLFPQINQLRVGPYQLTLESVKAADCHTVAV